MKTFERITEPQIKSRGVQALADRPNQTGQYGVGGLTAAQVKLHFDKLAMYLTEKLNGIFDVFSGAEAPAYIKLAIGEYESLEDLIASMGNGNFATRLLKVYPNGTHDEKDLSSLQAVLDGFAKEIGEGVPRVSDAAGLRRAYIVSKDGTQETLSIAEPGMVIPGTIPVYDKKGNLRANNLGGESDNASAGGAYDSSFNAADTPWSFDSESANTFHFKAFSYNAKSQNTDVDFRLRILADNAWFRYTCNLSSPYEQADESGQNKSTARILFKPGRVIFEDENKKDRVVYFKAYEKAVETNTEEQLEPPVWEKFVDEHGDDFVTLTHASQRATSYDIYVDGRYSYNITAEYPNLTFYPTDFCQGGPHASETKYTVYERHSITVVAKGDAVGYSRKSAPLLVEEEWSGTCYRRGFFTILEEDLREIWFEIKTSLGLVREAYLAVESNGGEISEVGLVQMPYEPYTPLDGFDSLTVQSDRWANKTAVINSSSRATAPYATAGGNDCVASGEASDVGGTGNLVEADGAFGRGTRNTITKKGKNSIQGGEGNTNDGYATTQVGVDLKNDGGNAAQFGTGNKNHANHTLQTGYNNEIPEGCDYAATIGANLKANAKYQGVHGKHNATDMRALELWGYGTAEEKKNVFAIPMSGTPEEDYDGITLGYFNKIMNQTVGNIEILLKTV